MTNLWQEHSLFPMFWIEEFAALNAEYKDRLDKLLTTPLRAVDATQWTMVIKIGKLILTLSVLIIFKKFFSFLISKPFLLLVCSWFDVAHSYGGYAGDS